MSETTGSNEAHVASAAIQTGGEGPHGIASMGAPAAATASVAQEKEATSTTPMKEPVSTSDSPSQTSSVHRKPNAPLQERDDDMPSLPGSDFGDESTASRTEQLLSINKHNPTSDPKNLIVNYIPTPVTDAELRKLFEPFGTVDSARIITDKANNHPKGYGFVKFASEKAATEAIKKMNGFEIGGKRLRVTRANGPKAPGAKEGTGSNGTSAQTSATQLPTVPSVMASQVLGVAGQGSQMMIPTTLPPNFQSYPGAGSPFAFLPPAAAPLPQSVYFSATLVAGGYQLNPQPFTFTAAGNTVIAQPVPIHGAAPIIYLPSQVPTLPASTDLYAPHTTVGAPPPPPPHSAAASTPTQAAPATSESATTQGPGTTPSNAVPTGNASGSQSGTPVAAGAPVRPLAFAPFSPPISQNYSVGGGSYSVFNSAASLEQCQPAPGSGYLLAPNTYPSTNLPAPH